MKCSIRSQHPFHLIYRVALLALLLYIGLLPTAIAGKPIRKYEMKAVWLTTNYGLDWPSRPATNLREEERQKAELIRLLDQLQDLGTNTIFLQVRSRGRVIYPSQIEPMSSDFVPSRSGYTLTYDPLAFAIQECYKRGMVVHAWLAVTPMGSEKQVREMPSWSFAKRHRSEMVRYKGSWYLDPAKHSTAQLMNDLVTELLTKYPIAGIHLDYIRYPDRAKQFPDSREYQKAKTTLSLDDWRRGNITLLVEAIYKTIKKKHPNVLLSASVIGTYNNVPGLKESGWTAYNDAWQDPKAWCQDSIIDFVVPMMYTRGERFYPFVKEWQKILTVPLVIGIAPYMVLEKEGNWDREEITQQLDFLDSIPQLSGVALFRAEHPLSNQIGLRETITQHWRAKMTLPLDRGVWMDWLDGQQLCIEGCEEGLMVKWHATGGNRIFALYLSENGEVPHGIEPPHMVTTSHKAIIPWRQLTKGTLIGIKVSEYDLVTQKETIPISGGVYYYKEESDSGYR